MNVNGVDIEYQFDGAHDANLRNVTLVVADGNKVGLYKADGKALKPVGKD